jgi:hypothetical protein
MKQFDDLNLVNNLSDRFAKAETSNNFKILQVEKNAVDELSTDIDKVYSALDIDTATGKTLDLYGEIVNQPRGLATDVQYRLMIKSKIMQNLSGGDFKSVLNAIYFTFSCDPSDISIIETSPCTVKVEKLPFSVLSEAGINSTQTMAIIKRLMPAGVKIEAFSFDGTFAFCESEADMKVDGATKGFTDTEANLKNKDATGGYLGAIYVGDEKDLPI